MKLIEIRFDDRQKNLADEKLSGAARTGAVTADTETDSTKQVVVGLFHDPFDGTGSRSLPSSPLRVDARGYGR